MRPALRHDAERNATGRVEVASHGRLHRLSRHRAVAFEIAVEERRIAEEHVVGIELVGLAAETAHRLEAIDELRLSLHASTIHLIASGTRTDEFLDCLEDDRLELAERMTRRRGRGDLRVSGDLPRVL